MHQFTTSGSTGHPKVIIYSDDQLRSLAISRGTAKGEGFRKIRSLFCDLSLKSTPAGILYKMWAEMNGVRFFTPSVHGIQATLRLFRDEDIDGIVGSTGGLINYALAGGAHRFRYVLGSGSATSARQSRMIRDGLGDNLYYGYGTSEVGSIALATAAQVEAIPGCAGALCPGAEVEIEQGEIRVKTTTMIDGYDAPALTAKHFRGGWFYPGDRGHFRSDGLLVLDGRL
jgi:acyl-CoA synthetase (AMP-forming)/AMP-acid ligase II